MKIVLEIIIVSWNTRDLLKECLESIKATLTFPGYKVTVVDNASSDGSAKMVKKYFPEVNLIKNSVNAGFAKANNQVIKDSLAEFILLLNSDTRLTQGALETMLYHMGSDPSIGVIGPKLVYPDGAPQISFYSDPTPLSEFKRAVFLEKLINLSKWKKMLKSGIIITDWVMGACMLIRTEVILKIGQLDENVFMYYEDFDLCLRARKAGWKVVFLPDSTVIHFENASGVKKFSSERYVTSVKSLAYFYRKHYPSRSLFFLKATKGLEAALRLFILLALYPFVKNKRYKDRVRSIYALLTGFVLRSQNEMK